MWSIQKLFSSAFITLKKSEEKKFLREDIEKNEIFFNSLCVRRLNNSALTSSVWKIEKTQFFPCVWEHWIFQKVNPVCVRDDIEKLNQKIISQCEYIE